MRKAEKKKAQSPANFWKRCSVSSISDSFPKSVPKVRLLLMPLELTFAKVAALPVTCVIVRFVVIGDHGSISGSP